MKKKYSYSLVMLALFISLSCEAQQKSIITKHKWIMVSATTKKPIDLNKKGKLSTNLLAQSPPCIRDNIFIYMNNGSFTVDDNKNLCEESHAGKKGKWRFIGKNGLHVDFGTGNPPIKYNIIKLVPGEMILSATMPFIPGGILVTYRFRKAG